MSSAGVPEEFQTVGAATGKLRRPSSVLVRGTSMSRRSAEWRCARPEMSEAVYGNHFPGQQVRLLEVCWASAKDTVEGSSSNLI